MEKPTSAVLPAELSQAKLRALLAAAGWYAKYHEPMIAEQADDQSAAAVVRREQFEALHRALRKLGVRLRAPAWVSSEAA